MSENGSTRKYDFVGLNKELLNHVGELLIAWLPGGKMVTSNEYGCGDLTGAPPKDGKGGSLRVNVTTGQWSDFATGESGGDLISLYAAIFSKTQSEAYLELRKSNFLNLNGGNVKVQIQNKNIVASVFQPPGSHTPPPDFYYEKYGDPIHVYTYKDKSENILFHVARYEKGTIKEFIPYSYTGKQWIKKMWKEPRPLYGLWRLRDGFPVLVVEGEKAADAAYEMFSKWFDIVSWPSGAQAYKKADWSPVYGREIVLWPDCDMATATSEADCRKYGVNKGDLIPSYAQVGTKAMLGVAELLQDHCNQIRLIDVNGHDRYARIHEGFDAADALKLGWDIEALKEWASKITIPIGVDGHPDKKNETLPSYMPKQSKTHSAVESELVPMPQGDLEDGEISVSFQELWMDLGLSTKKNGLSVIQNMDNVVRVFDRHPAFKDFVWIDTFHNKMFTRGIEYKNLDSYRE
ncbi:MAG: hypothetical protein KDI92_15925, partial [Xanthomonadales bacterium]|nr:hypothetical protein [Xanthomonadales bacterium]